LRAHLDARTYRPCRAVAPALAIPEGLVSGADLRALAALAVAHTFGLLDGLRAAAVPTLMQAALDGGADAALERADPASALVWCIAAAEWCERHGLDGPFSRLETRAALVDAEAPPWARVHWRLAAAWHHDAFGRRVGVATLIEDAERLATDAHDVGLQVVAWLHRARLVLFRSDPSDAEALARRAAQYADERSAPLWLADAADIAARAALIRGDLHRALHESRRAAALGELAQVTPAYNMTYRLYEAYALLGLGSWDEATKLAEELAAIPLPARLTERIKLLATLFALVRDDRMGRWTGQSTEVLRVALRRLRELDWPDIFSSLPQSIGRLWARALEQDVEADWVRASIRTRALPPPEPALPVEWPWSVRVSVVGAFAVVVDGSDLALGPAAKAAAKPLALLRRLALDGGYDGVSAAALASALWPGQGRVGRDKALETTLARLRKLLGYPDAILAHERRLRLNPQRVWLDSVALLRMLEPGATVRDAAGQVLSLWRGPLLADDVEDDWLRQHREQWCLRSAAQLARHASQSALQLHARAVDPGLRVLLDPPSFGAFRSR
jgi:hypothetical protein